MLNWTNPKFAVPIYNGEQDDEVHEYVFATMRQADEFGLMFNLTPDNPGECAGEILVLIGPDPKFGLPDEKPVYMCIDIYEKKMYDAMELAQEYRAEYGDCL